MGTPKADKTKLEQRGASNDGTSVYMTGQVWGLISELTSNFPRGYTGLPRVDINPPAPDSPYRLLDLGSKQIRLFELLLAEGSCSVRGNFTYEYTHGCPAYTALSYTWGELTETRLIKIGGCTVDI